MSTYTTVQTTRFDKLPPRSPANLRGSIGYDETMKGGHRKSSADVAAMRKSSVAAMNDNATGEIRNPLAGIPREELLEDVQAFAERNGMLEEVELLRKGALVAQRPADFENMDELDEEDKVALREEITRRWKHPKQL